ncbi:MAG: HK97 gp10 family phage protein [Sarcina sp.]
MNEVEINLNRVITELLPNAIAEGLEKCGQIVENEAKRNAPLDTGILRASMFHVVNDGKPYQSFEDSGSGKTKEARLVPTKTSINGKCDTVIIATNVEYATVMHEKHNSKGKYLQRAVDENMDKCLRVFDKLLDRQVLR